MPSPIVWPPQQCKVTLPDGTQCRVSSIIESGYCGLHQPPDEPVVFPIPASGAHLPPGDGTESVRIQTLEDQMTTLLWQQVERDVYIGNLQQEILSLRAQNSAMATRLQGYHLSKIDMSNKQAAQASKVKEYEITMHNLKNALTDCEAEIAASQAKQNVLQKETCTWKDGYNRQTKNLTAAHEKALALDNGRDSLRLQLEKMASDRHAMHERITSLKSQLDDAQGRAHNAERREAETENELDRTHSKISKLEANLGATNRRAKDAERKLAEMVSTIKAMRASDHTQMAPSSDDRMDKMNDENDGENEMECDEEEKSDRSVISQNESGAVSDADAQPCDVFSLIWWLVFTVLLLSFLMLAA